MDMMAPLSSGATSTLGCTVSVSIPSAPGKREMQTSARNKQSRSPSDRSLNTYKEKESIVFCLLDLCLEKLRKYSGFVIWRSSEGRMAMNCRLSVLASAVLLPMEAEGGQGLARDEL